MDIKKLTNKEVRVIEVLHSSILLQDMSMGFAGDHRSLFLIEAGGNSDVPFLVFTELTRK